MAEGVGASRGSAPGGAGAGRGGATLALVYLHPGLQHPRPEKSLAPPGGREQAGSAAPVSHKKSKKKKKWPPREPGRGAEARGGGGRGQRTIRST
ncbi:serine/arginine repetitive matrix protein 3-like isoform X1 [Hyaena hyaena]|uniref:serine/arginine repetitive matrix protein 3-like isoform X1 n=1 Tax=Hyaena hyaena TaxID=95912 RepID=UPI0019220CCF|nr:serine/arginine repetitive matrix protein 3-like isoform X1 [Hyaena hyaena]